MWYLIWLGNQGLFSWRDISYPRTEWTSRDGLSSRAEVAVTARCIQGFIDMTQKKPFPCVEYLLCAPAYTHVSLIMAEALQGKPSLLGHRGGIQTYRCQTPKSTLSPSHKLPLLWSSVWAQRQKKVEEQRLRQKLKLELYIYIYIYVYTHTYNIYVYLKYICNMYYIYIYIIVLIVQSLSCVWFFVTLRTAACQASLTCTISWSLL